jgi:hypothetical protein
MDPSPNYVRLTFKPLPSDAPVEIRLKRLLKAALRWFGFRCVRVEEVSPIPPPPEALK